MSHLDKLNDDEKDPVRLWAEIHMLREAMMGPEGFATWKESALSEHINGQIDGSSKAMFVARLANMQAHGDHLLNVANVMALLNDCNMLATR